MAPKPTPDSIVALYKKRDIKPSHSWGLGWWGPYTTCCPMTLVACDKIAGETGGNMKDAEYDRDRFRMLHSMSNYSVTAHLMGWTRDFVLGFVDGYDSRCGYSDSPTQCASDDHKEGFALGLETKIAVNKEVPIASPKS